MLKDHHELKGNPPANVHSLEELTALDCSVREIVIDNNVLTDPSFTETDMSRFVNLSGFEVGNYCFCNVDKVKLIGMKKLETVIIGEKCFSVDSFRENMGKHFCLKNCERLRELKIGKHSFPDYDVCEIENNASLEVIEIGELNEDSGNFSFGSLTLRSEYDGIE